MKLDISNQGEMAFPREKGLSAAPGFATSIGIRKASVSMTLWKSDLLLSCM